MSADGQGTKCRINFAENFNRLSRVRERYRQTDNRRTGDIERELTFTFAKNREGHKLRAVGHRLVYCSHTIWVAARRSGDVVGRIIKLVAWFSGRTSVLCRRAFAVLLSACS